MEELYKKFLFSLFCFPPLLAATLCYFLLLAQKKVTKEKGSQFDSKFPLDQNFLLRIGIRKSFYSEIVRRVYNLLFEVSFGAVFAAICNAVSFVIGDGE
jgi:hypothetical protein